ncbi:Hypothetical protein A7982_04945 [Minicystis rosea]|nr:Hypothetical protein A7982_04945 [Minicystis rosea]
MVQVVRDDQIGLAVVIDVRRCNPAGAFPAGNAALSESSTIPMHGAPPLPGV